MLTRPRQPLDALSISALDLFASALGAFMLLAVSFFPYYLRAPALELAQEGARAELAAAAQALKEAETASADAEAKKAGAERNAVLCALTQMPPIFSFSRSRIGWVGPFSTTTIS